MTSFLHMSIETQFWFSITKKNFWVLDLKFNFKKDSGFWILNPFVKEISDLKSIFPEDFEFWFEILSMPDFVQPWHAVYYWLPTTCSLFSFCQKQPLSWTLWRRCLPYLFRFALGNTLPQRYVVNISRRRFILKPTLTTSFYRADTVFLCSLKFTFFDISCFWKKSFDYSTGLWKNFWNDFSW